MVDSNPSSSDQTPDANITKLSLEMKRIGKGADLIRAAVQETAESLSPKEKKLRALAALREKEKEWMSPHNYHLQDLDTMRGTHELPPEQRAFLCSKDIKHATGMQPVVLDRDDLRHIVYIAYVAANGKVRVMTPRDMADDDAFILLPADLGDEPEAEDSNDPERIATHKLLEIALALREAGRGPITREVFFLRQEIGK